MINNDVSSLYRLNLSFINIYLIGRYGYFGHAPTNESFPDVHVNRGGSCMLIRAAPELGVIEIHRVSPRPVCGSSAFPLLVLNLGNRLSNPAPPLEIEGSSNPARRMRGETPNHSARMKPSPSKLLSGHLAIAMAGFSCFFFSDAFFTPFFTVPVAVASLSPLSTLSFLYYTRIFYWLVERHL